MMHTDDLSGPIGGIQGGSYAQQSKAQSPLAAALQAAGVKDFGDRLLAKARERMKMGPLRPARQFFGLGEAKPFGFSGSGALLRVKTNLPFFLTNYILLYALLTLLGILSSPVSLICYAALGAGWFVVMRAQNNPEVDRISLGSVNVAKNHAYYAMIVISAICGSLLLKTMFSWPLWIGGSFAMGHALLRDNTALLQEQAGNVEDDELRAFVEQA